VSGIWQIKWILPEVKLRFHAISCRDLKKILNCLSGVNYPAVQVMEGTDESNFIQRQSKKEWNTATLLKKALEGATSQGAHAELIHLYDLNSTGCKSCFACKLRGGESYGHCAVQDDLAPILKKVEEADALILGSPIYFGTFLGK
jgi:hypothetical protein